MILAVVVILIPNPQNKSDIYFGGKKGKDEERGGKEKVSFVF